MWNERETIRWIIYLGGESSKAITRLRQSAKMPKGTLTNQPRIVAMTAPFIRVFEAGSKAALNTSKVA